MKISHQLTLSGLCIALALLVGCATDPASSERAQRSAKRLAEWQTRREEMVKRFDVNGDGKLDATEKEAMAQEEKRLFKERNAARAAAGLPVRRTFVWSMQYPKRGWKLEAGTAFKISIVETQQQSNTVAMSFAYVGDGAPPPARLTILLGRSPEPTCAQDGDFMDDNTFGKTNGVLSYQFEVPQGSKVFLATPAPKDSHSGPIVCLSNVLDLPDTSR